MTQVPVLPPTLELVATRSADHAVLRVTGEVDVSTAPGLQACLSGLHMVGCRELVLDLAGVSFLDAAGVAVLVRAATAARHQHGTVTLRRPSRQVRRILELTRLADAFPVDPPADRQVA